MQSLTFLFPMTDLIDNNGVPRNFFSGGGVQQIQLSTEDRDRGSGGGSPLVRGSGGSCNLVQARSLVDQPALGKMARPRQHSKTGSRIDLGT
jgi:hypothetical protein